MKKISLFAIASSAALMTACTDYVSKIEELEQDVWSNYSSSSVTTSSGCVCNLQASNLLRDNFGNLYYDYSILGDGDMADEMIAQMQADELDRMSLVSNDTEEEENEEE